MLLALEKTLSKEGRLLSVLEFKWGNPLLKRHMVAPQMHLWPGSRGWTGSRTGYGISRPSSQRTTSSSKAPPREGLQPFPPAPPAEDQCPLAACGGTAHIQTAVTNLEMGPGLVTWVWSLEPMGRWKERTNSAKLSSDLYMCVVVHVPDTYCKSY